MLKPDNLPVTFGKNDVEIIARETLYRGFFSLDLYRFRHRLFNGQMSHEVRREIFERGHAAVLLPFDPVLGWGFAAIRLVAGLVMVLLIATLVQKWVRETPQTDRKSVV